MVQRIQIVYMLTAGVVATITILFGLDWLRTLLFTISVVAALYTIFRYKKRNLQQLLNWLNIVINFTLLGIFVYRMLNSSGEGTISGKGVGVFVPVLSIVLLFLVSKAIRRDEKLVESADRLR